jgi:hypothetical protein
MRRPRIAIIVAASATALLSPRTSLADPTSSTVPTSRPTSRPTSQAGPRAQQVLPEDTEDISWTETRSAPYLQPADVVTERTITRHPNWMLLKTGATVFGLAYGVSVVAAGASHRGGDKTLYIPLVGPWFDLGNRGCTLAAPCGVNEDLAKAMVVASGVLQTAGLLLFVGSWFVPESSLIVVERTKLSARTEPPKPKVSVLPISFGAGAGLAAVGRF